MRRAAVVALAALILLAAAAGPAAASMAGGGGPGPAGPDRTAALTGDPAVRQTTTPENGTAVRHVDPGRTDAVDYDRIEGWLSLALSGRLGESAGELDEGDYERARAVLGDDVDRYLDQYADVAEETSGDADDRLAAEFAAAATNQRAFAERVDGFERTAAEYRDARAAGDEDRARRLARDLVERAATVNRTGAALTGNYSAIEDGTGADLSEETAVVRRVAADVTATGEEAARETLEPTRVHIATSPTVAAFDDPLALDGRVTTENGTSVAEGRVRLVVGGRTLTTNRTGANGSFALSARPVLVEAGTRTATVRYVPAADSVYLGSSATATVDVDSVEPAVDLAVTPSEGRFDDRLRAVGRVAVAGTGVPGVPVVLAVAGAERVRVETDRNGYFAGTLRLPADVAPGTRALSARLPTAGLAIGAANTDRPVEVAVSGTDLTLSAERTGPGAGRVSGTLVADGERPVGGQPVAIVVDGERVGSATTNGEGRFAADVSLPGDTAARVEGRFDGAGTNLEEATAAASVPPAAAGNGAAESPLPDPSPLTWAVAGLGLLALGAAAVLLRRRRRRAPVEPPAVGETAAPAADVSSAPDGLLDRARDTLAEGRPDLAVRVAYGAARERLGGDVEGAATRTHWEFYRARADGLDADRDAAFRTLTEAFERAAFAPAGADRETATRAIEAAGRLVERG